MKKLIFIIVVIMLTGTSGQAFLSIPKEEFIPNPQLTLEPLYLSEATILIDGVLDSVWTQAAHFENFAEFMPAHQIPAKVPTEGYITQDDSHLYIAFICYDPEIENLRASMTDRDHIFNDDFVGVVIDTYQDHQTAYEFFANPYGIQGDMLWQANSSSDEEGPIWQPTGAEHASYEAVWESDGQIYNDHWIVEMKIPFASLRYSGQTNQNWGVHFVRTYPRENRYQFSWMPISQDSNTFMGQAGYLKLNVKSDVATSRALEVLPYVIGTYDNHLGYENPEVNTRGAWHDDRDGRYGISAKYTLNSNNVLNFTYRPDFSQIESDAGQISVNNPYGFFYSERRPFFVEGNDIFQVDRGVRGLLLDTPANLVYTRSINDPLVAGKITGKSGKLSYGVISAYDEKTYFNIPWTDGVIFRESDAASYNNVVRAKYDVGKQSFIGLVATHRLIENEDGSNFAGAIDASIRLSEKYALLALVGTTYTNEPDHEGFLIRPIQPIEFEVGDKKINTAFNDENFAGHVARIRFLRQTRNWNYSLGYQDYSPGFRADNSSVFTNDGRVLTGWTGYAFWYDEHPVLTRFEPSLGVWRKTDYQGDVKDTGVSARLSFSFKHQTNVTINSFLFNREKFNEVKFGDARNIWLAFNTTPLQKISLSLFGLYGETINRNGIAGYERMPLAVIPNIQLNASGTLRPTDSIQSSVQYNCMILRTHDDELVAEQHIVRSTFSYQFSKRLFIRLVGEINHLEYYSVFGYDANSGEYLGGINNSTTFAFEPLLSYKLNPFTVFYMGANFGGQKDPNFENYDGYTATDQTVFLKMQYLWNVL